MTNKKEQNVQLTYVLLLIGLAASILLLARILFSFLPDKRVSISDQKVDVLIADTPKEREKGLSGRQRLTSNEGMLFIFTDEGEYCFWMKDMNFPIDMIWMNSAIEVVHIQKNAQPDSYPSTFCPDKPAKYVLEVNAGKVDEWGVDLGDQARL